VTAAILHRRARMRRVRVALENMELLEKQRLAAKKEDSLRKAEEFYNRMVDYIKRTDDEELHDKLYAKVVYWNTYFFMMDDLDDRSTT